MKSDDGDGFRVLQGKQAMIIMKFQVAPFTIIDSAVLHGFGGCTMEYDVR
jgi:hypothetical protein